MPATEQHQVAHRGDPAVRPVAHVVTVAPRGGPVAPGEPAVAIAHHHRPAHRGGDHRGLPAHVEGLGCPPHHHPGHRGVAGHLPGHLRVDGPHILELGAPSQVPGQGVHIHHHGEVGALPAHDGAIGAVKELPAHLP